MGADVLRFASTTHKVQTLADGGVRVTLDVINPQANTVLALIQTAQPGIIIEWAGVALQQDNNAIPEGQIRKSGWTTEEGPGANQPA